MNIKNKMQKIISAAILCFAFFIFVPVAVAEVAGMKTVENNIQISVKQRDWVNTTIQAAFLPTTVLIPSWILPDALKTVQDANIKVNLESASGKKEGVSDNSYTALSLLAGGGNELGLINPATKKPYEKENIYTIGTNDGVSYYYKPNGGTGTPEEIDKWQNDNTVLIAHANDGKVYFPDGIDSEGNKINYIVKGGAEEDDFNNSIDIVAGRDSGTTNKKLDALDKLQENIDTLEEDKKELADLRERQQNDAEPGELDEDIRELEEKIRQKEADIQTGTEAGASTQISLKCSAGIDGIYQFFTSLDCITSVLAIVGNIVLKVSAWVLYITGQLFDLSIEIAVNSAQFIAGLKIVEPTWAAIRDFLNMTFIFILIYISWQILLGNTNYNVKSSVARLVLVAILINFSLFAAKIMVDGSNIISLNIYEGIKSKGEGEPGRGSVSTRIMSTLGLGGVFNFSDAFNNQAIEGCGSVPSTILMVSIFGTIMILITAMTFLLAAILFFLRMLNILALFITSPIWVWGYVIQHPKVKEQSDKWWSNMVHVMKFPIMYMLILYVSLAMFAQLSSSQTVNGVRISILQVICNTATRSGKSVPIADQLPIILNFILVIAALIGAIKYSAGEATKGNILGTGKFGANIAGKFEGFSRKMTTGAAQGLYNKAKTPAGLATLATIATGGAYGGVVAGAAAAGLLSKPARTFARDGVRLVGQNTTDWLSNKAGEHALASKNPKFQTAFAMLSNKLKDAKVLGETRKDASARRTKGVTERATTLAKVLEEQTKIEDREAWMKKNPGGDYAAYQEAKLDLIAKTQLGALEDASHTNSKGEVVQNKDFVRDVWEESIAKDGTVTKKINQDKLYRNIQKIREAHKKDGSLLKLEQASRLGWVTRERAEARIAAQDKALMNRRVGKEKGIEDKKKKIEKLKEQLERFPADIDKAATEADLKKYDGRVGQFKREGDADKKDKIKEELMEKRESIENQIEKILKDIQNIEEKEAKKKEEGKK